MPAPELVLHVLPPSHPCLAVQAALEIKGLEYDRVELSIPFAADVEAVYGEGRTTVPGMLVDGERVHGSVAIMERLEELVPTPALYPGPKADRVTEAVRWADGLFQDVGRRLPWGALYFRPEAMGTMVAGGAPLNPAGTDAAITLVRQVWKGRGLTAAQLADDLQALPGLLDHVDALLADGVVGGKQATAADLTIGSTLDVLRMIGDIRGLIDLRPCARLATDWFEERPGRIPAGAFPADWVPQPA